MCAYGFAIYSLCARDMSQAAVKSCNSIMFPVFIMADIVGHYLQRPGKQLRKYNCTILFYLTFRYNCCILSFVVLKTLEHRHKITVNARWYVTQTNLSKHLDYVREI